MESILFVMDYSTEGKCRRKYDDQMRACLRLGLDVWCIAMDTKQIYLVRKTEESYKRGKTCDDKRIPLRKRMTSAHPIISENLTYISIYKAVLKALKIKNDFTYSYIRRFFYEPACCKAFSELNKHGTKNIVEIPTYPPFGELDAVMNLPRRIMKAYNLHYENKAAKNTALFAPMGDTTNEYLGRPALNIENGIDVFDIKLRKPCIKENEIHILALAVMAYWHGYDRIIRGMKEYSGDKKIVLHLVGEGGVLTEWRKLAEDCGVIENVLFEGVKNNEQLNETMDSYDIGAASLGRYRSGMSTIYELKTREYMARGLPFIYAIDDHVLDELNQQYCMKIPNNDSPVDLNEVEEFVMKMRSDGDVCQKMRDYAKQHMTFDTEYQKLLDFFRRNNS